MEKMFKAFPAKNWLIFQNIFLIIIGLQMIWVFERSGWNLIVAIWLVICARSCWSIYRGVQRQSVEATDQQRFDVNWQFSQIAIAIMSLLTLCLILLKK